MDESLKSRIILILSVLSAMLFIATVGSCRDAYMKSKSRDKEMVKRLDFEEKATKSMQEKAALEGNIQKLQKELEEEKASHQVTQKALLQEQMVNQSLKEELGKLTKLKEALEDDLKEALVNAKAAKTKK